MIKTIEQTRCVIARWLLGQILFEHQDAEAIPLSSLRYHAERDRMTEDWEYVLNRDFTTVLLMSDRIERTQIYDWFCKYGLVQPGVF